MVLFLTCGAVLILIGLFFLWLAFRGRKPENLVETVGALTRRQHFKNVQLRHRRVKNLTDYAYSYTVGGRTYKLSGIEWIHPRKLFPKTTIVYLKGFPRVAYIGEFTGIQEWALAIVFLVMGLLCLWISTQVS